MSRAVRLGVLAAALALAAAAHAQTQPKLQVTVHLQDQSPAPQAEAKANQVVVTGERKPRLSDPDKIVCREEPVTGSKFIHNVCAPQRDWDQQAQDAQRLMNRFDHLSGGVGPNLTPPSPITY